MKRGRRPALSQEDADHLREMYLNPKYRETPSTLAKLFRVSAVTVSNVLNRAGAYQRKGM